MKKIIFVALALVFAAPVMAGQPWTYAQVGYVEFDSNLATDCSECNGEERNRGYDVRGSVGFLENWHAQAAYTKLKGEPGNAFDYRQSKGYMVRAGLHQGLTDATDLVFDLAYNKRKASGSQECGGDCSSGDDGETSWFTVRLGPQTLIGEKFGLGAFVSYARGKEKNDDGDKFSDMSFSATADYYFTPALSLGAEFNLQDGDMGDQPEGDSLLINVRYSFTDRW